MHRDLDMGDSELIQKCPKIDELNFKHCKTDGTKKAENGSAEHLDSLQGAHTKTRKKHG